MIRAGALCLLLAAAPAFAQTAPKAHVEKVVQVFLAMGCVIDPIRHGAKAEKAAGLSDVDFSKAVAVLESRDEVTMDEATFQFRLKHKDCP